MNKIIYIIASLLILSSGLKAKEDLSLAKAIQKGLKNNYSILIAEKDVEISRNNDSWGKAGRYPKISIGVDFRNSITNLPSSENLPERTDLTKNNFNPNITLNWKIFDGFRINITKKKLANLNQLSEGKASIVIENTIHAIVLGYYNAVLQQKKLEVTEEVMKLSKDRYEKVQMRKELGTSTTYDLLQAEIAWLDDKASWHKQKLNLKTSLRNLNLLLVQPSETDYIFTSQLTPNLKDYQPELLAKKMLDSNRNLVNQFINLKILENNLKLSRSELYPSLSLISGASLNRERSKYENLPSSTSNTYNYYANFSLAMTIFNGGNIKREIANAKLKLKTGELEIAELKFTLKNRLNNTLELYSVRKDLYEVATQRLKSAKLNLSISGEKLNSGAINSFNYRDVQLIYLNAAFSKLQAIYNLIETDSDLARITGSIVTER